MAVLVIIFFAFTFNTLQNTKKDTTYSGEVVERVVSDTDKTLVENYIRKNIDKLVPERSVLGGTWYMTEIKINTTSRTGTFKYEDRHVEGEAEFRFTKTSENLLSVGIKKIR